MSSYISSFEVWIEDQAANYWTSYSACKTKFKAGVILPDVCAPAIYLPATFQEMANVILRNTQDCAQGTFNNQIAFVFISDNNCKTLRTFSADYFHNNQGIIQSTFHKNAY